MRRKILALDLDGTTVDDKSRLGVLTKKAFQKARQAGHIICFVTGRRDVDMVLLGDDYRLVDYLILNNGGKIVACADKKVLKNVLVETEDAYRLITYCLEKNYPLHILSGMYWGINKMNPGTQKYIDELGAAPVFYHDLEETPFDRIEGFTASVEGPQIGAFIDREGLNLCYVQSEPTCMDIMKKGISKWSGIRDLAGLLDIPLQDTIAAGNYTNDIDMLVHAGVGVAVQNALPEVKAIADYVTRADNNHNAAAEIIEKFLFGCA